VINQIFTRLQLMFAEGVGVLIGATKVQAKVLDGEPLNNIHRVEPYGYSYRPKPGCQTYLVFPSGDRTTGLALIIGDTRYQMDLQAGEVAIHDDEGNHVLLKRGGIIEAKASTKVIADTPLFETTQDAKIGGNLLIIGRTISEAGYYGQGGGVAHMQAGLKIDGGLDVIGHSTCNGKDVSDGHKHTDHSDGGLIVGVV
jgi:phage baseplate assembly protein V